MKKSKLIKILISAVIIIALSAGCIFMAQADFGDFSGDSDYGGGGWSDWGDSDYGSDNDYSYGNDYDDDYSYNRNHDSDYEFSSDWLSTLIGLAIVAFVIWIVVFSKKKNTGSRPRVTTGVNTFHTDLNPMSTYTALDPNFSETELRDKISNLYVKMQNSWTKRDLTEVQPYFTDAYYKQMERQVQQYIERRYTNYVDKIAVLGVDFLGWKKVDNQDHLYVKVSTRITDYTVEDSTGAVIKGSKTAEKFMVYEWDVSRESGMITTHGKEDSGLDSKVCPHCGAPLDMNATARCEYCGSTITTKKHDWAICNIKGISQTTR